jgi:hypothetical protein
MRGRITVEHKLGSARRTTQRFGYPDYPANATDNPLQPADVHLGDKWLMVGNVLKDPPPTPPRTNHVPAPRYQRIWGQTVWPEADQAARFISVIANNTTIISSESLVKGGHGTTGCTLAIQTGLMTSDKIQNRGDPSGL